MKKIFAVLLALPLAALAAAGTVDDPVRASIKKLSADAQVQSISDGPVAGLKEVRADGQIMYFSADGRHLILGDVVEVSSKQNLTETARASIRAEKLNASDQKDHIVYGPRNNPRKVYVFTDTSCPYCERLHGEVPKLLAAGITVEYLAWPRGGPRSPAYADMQSVWCSKDKAAAYDKVIAGQKVESSKCDSPIRKHYELGESLQVQGTPAVYDSKGVQIGGYVPAERIIEALKS